MITGYYADPTAWEAIAKADKPPRDNHEAHSHDHYKGADGTCHIGVYHAPGAKTLNEPATLYRPENRSVLTALRRRIYEHDSNRNNRHHLFDPGLDNRHE
jgi:hypothetical protein